MRHENIIQSFDYFFNELTEEIHIVMNYVEGQEVLDQIAEQESGKYTEDSAQNLFKQIM